MTSMSNDPTDYNLQLQALDRRRKLADLLLQQSQQDPQGQMVSGIYVKPSSLNLLANALQNVQATQQHKELDNQEAGISANYRAGLGNAVQKYLETSQGKTIPGQDASYSDLRGEYTAPTDATTVPGNPKQAMLDALASQYAPLQQLGMKQLTEKSQGLEPKDLASKATLASILANPNDPTKWEAPLKDLGGVAYKEGSNTIVPLKTDSGSETWPQYKGPDGDMYRVNPSTGKPEKLDNAPKITNVVSATNAGQKAGTVEYFKKAAEQVSDMGKSAAQAAANVQAIAELRRLDGNGIYSNPTSNFATFASNLAQAFNIPIDPTKLANTQTFNSGITELWQGTVQKLGGNRGVTAPEAEQIKQMLPLASHSPEARKQIYAIMENAAARQINQYKQADKSFADAASSDDPRIFANGMSNVYLPAASAPSPITPSTVPNVNITPGVPLDFNAFRKQQGL